MKNYLLWEKSKQAFCASAAVVLSIFSLVAQAQVVTPPSGFITLTIRGTGGATSSRLSFLGLSMTRPVEYQGYVEAVSAPAAGATLLTDNDANWTDNQFNGA